MTTRTDSGLSHLRRRGCRGTHHPRRRRGRPRATSRACGGGSPTAGRNWASGSCSASSRPRGWREPSSSRRSARRCSAARGSLKSAARSESRGHDVQLHAHPDPGRRTRGCVGSDGRLRRGNAGDAAARGDRSPRRVRNSARRGGGVSRRPFRRRQPHLAGDGKGRPAREQQLQPVLRPSLQDQVRGGGPGPVCGGRRRLGASHHHLRGVPRWNSPSAGHRHLAAGDAPRARRSTPFAHEGGHHRGPPIRVLLHRFHPRTSRPAQQRQPLASAWPVPVLWPSTGTTSRWRPSLPWPPGSRRPHRITRRLCSPRRLSLADQFSGWSGWPSRPSNGLEASLPVGLNLVRDRAATRAA
jgi:hypothetical protein